MSQERNEKAHWLEYISQNWTWDFEQIPKDLMNELDIWYEIIKSRPSMYSSMPEIFKENRDLAFYTIRNNGMNLQYLNLGFRNDFEMVCSAVINDARALEFASERLKDNDNLIEKIDFEHRPFGGYKQGNYLRFASKRILRNSNYLFKAIQNDEWGKTTHYNNKQPLISYLESDMQLDFELAKLSVINNYESFDFLDDSLQENLEIVKLALNQSGDNIRDLTPGMRNSSYIIEKFAIENSDYLKFASDKLKDNDELILKIVGIDGMCLEYASERIKDNKEIVLSAIINNGLAVQFASNNLKNDHEIGLNAVTENGDSLEFLSENLKDNLEIVSSAITIKNRFRKKISWGNTDKEEMEIKDGCAIRWASLRLKSNKDLVLKAILNSNEIELDTFGFSQTKRYKEIPLASFLPDIILKDKEIALRLIKNNPNSRKYLNPINILSKEDYKLIEHNLDKNNQPNINVINKIQKVKTNYPNHNLLKKLEDGGILYREEIIYTPFANIQLSDFMTYYFGQIISK